MVPALEASSPISLAKPSAITLLLEFSMQTKRMDFGAAPLLVNAHDGVVTRYY